MDQELLVVLPMFRHRQMQKRLILSLGRTWGGTAGAGAPDQVRGMTYAPVLPLSRQKWKDETHDDQL